MTNLLTVAMAAYREFDSVYFTVQGLRANHGDGFDVLVVDNAPEGCPRTRQVTLAAGGTYVHRPDLNGTSRPRDACFQFARTPWVLVCDSHVLFETGAIDATVRYCEAHPDSRDILSGPLVGDDGRWVSTHWNPPPDAPTGLWGSWATDARGQLPFLLFNPSLQNALAPPFEIPMMGLGCFAMRRAVWPGFHHLMRGFGGEEGYVHEKVRQLGGKALCLPALRWRHKFRDIAGWDKNPIPYPATTEDHVRNLLLGHRELGVEGYEELIRDRFGKKTARFAELAAEVREKVPFGKITPPTKRQRILGVWYSNNSAPESLLRKSLEGIRTAAEQSRHDVRIVTVPWKPIPGNPFQEVLAAYRDGPGHLNIVRQIRQGIGVAPGMCDGCVTAGDRGETPAVREGSPSCACAAYLYDAVCFLEHDVLYAPGYFDRVGDAFARNPEARVVSHLDYIGLNGTGWLAVRERHEPLHQLSMRTAFALENLDRAEADAVRDGVCLLEPDSAPQRRVTPQFAEVEPGLWIGEQTPAPPPGVTAVLSVMGVDDERFGGKPDPYATDPGLIYSHQPISDDHLKAGAPPLEWLKGRVGWIEEQVGRGHSVFVHCLGGVSRSGLVVTAYLMRAHGVTREAALSYIREVRPQVAPRPAFWQILAEYAASLPQPLRSAVPRKSPRADWVRLPPDGFAPSVHVNH